MSADDALARELENALEGREAGAEARALATLLEAAAAPYRIHVPEEETARAVAALPPRVQARPVPRLVPAVGIAVAVALGALVWVLRTPGTDVQARAAKAIDAPYFFVERVRSARPGLFGATDVSGYVDAASGRAHVRISGVGSPVDAETVVRPGRVQRWVGGSNVLFVAASCDAFVGGCAEALDPLDLYVQTIESGFASASRAGDTYRLTLRGRGLDEIVVVDAKSYLPRRIVWRQRGKTVATARFVVLERQRAVSTDAWTMSAHPGARIVQLAEGARRVHLVRVRRLALPRGVLWLGRTYDGRRARVDDVSFNAGHATRIAYGRLRVWNYDRIVPPDVLRGWTGQAKVFAVRGGVVRLYFAPSSGAVVADATVDGRNVAVVDAAGGDNLRVIRAVQALRLAR